ncbi:MAG: 4Fe-4S dicluster domain-containing protein [Solirubrobacterales bacterium]
MGAAPDVAGMTVIGLDGLDALLDALRERGYRTVGPVLRDGAILYDEIGSSADLPVGWTDRQEGGTYRVERREDGALFGFNVGPHSTKRFLHPPRLRLFRARRDGPAGLDVSEERSGAQYAFVGVRSCELGAIAISDRVLAGGEFPDPHYADRRRGAFLLAVNCGQAGSTCFCASMGTGPRAEGGFDLSLTEVIEGGRHYFTVECGSERGAEVLAGLPREPAGPREREASLAASARAEAQMGRRLDTDELPELLARNLDHPRWDEVAERCLTCGNCTMVCPTCFCTTVTDLTDLAGAEAERVREWDSCFSQDFSYVHGGSVRSSARSRYRQWMTHKLSTWWGQFGSSGCVGCGRCITWCPVAIDITEEAAAIRAADGELPASGGQRGEVVA